MQNVGGGTTMRDLRGYMTPEEITRVIGQGKTARDQLLMEVLWVTGARISEVVSKPWGLAKKNILVEENTLVLRTLKRRLKKVDKKTGEVVSLAPPERRVVIPKQTVIKLADFTKNLQPDDYVFPITRQHAFEIVREAGTQAGVPKVGEKRIHPHHFRHSHCVAYVKKNNTIEGLRKLQDRLKHSNFASTAQYLQFSTIGEEKEIEDIFGARDLPRSQVAPRADTRPSPSPSSSPATPA